MRSAHQQTLLELFADPMRPEAPRRPAGEMLQRATERARALGLVALGLGMQGAGEARDLVGVLAAIALQGVRDGRAASPTVILSAGPVLMGGREVGAASLLLTLALALDAHPAIYALAAGWASEEGARIASAGGAWGALLAPDTLLRARSRGIQPEAMLVAGRAAELFGAIGDCVLLDGCSEGEAPASATGLTAVQMQAVVLRAVLLV